MQGAIVLVVVLAAFYMFSKSSEKDKAVQESAKLPEPKAANVQATTGSTSTLKDIIHDISEIFGDVTEVIDGVTDRNK